MLWPRDPTAFRAVLADWPGAESPEALIRSLLSVGLPTDRDDLLRRLELGEAERGHFGVVAGLRIEDWTDLATPVDRGVRILRVLGKLLVDKPLVLRAEGGAAEEAIRVAAAIARRARSHVGAVEALTRLRSTDGARAVSGGVATAAVSAICQAIRSRRQEQGAEVPWPREAGPRRSSHRSGNWSDST